MKTVKTILGDLTPEMYQDLSPDPRFIVLCDLALQDYKNNESLCSGKLAYLDTPKKERFFVATFPDGTEEKFFRLKDLAHHCNVSVSMVNTRCRNSKPLNDGTFIKEVTVINW